MTQFRLLVQNCTPDASDLYFVVEQTRAAKPCEMVHQSSAVTECA
ncbi:hypothetical protein [Pseudomonas sp. ZB1P45]